MTTMDRMMSATEAMTLSQREDRIVHLEYREQLARDLYDDAEGGVDAGEVCEYWGAAKDCDGEPVKPWRVHLHRPDVNKYGKEGKR